MRDEGVPSPNFMGRPRPRSALQEPHFHRLYREKSNLIALSFEGYSCCGYTEALDYRDHPS